MIACAFLSIDNNEFVMCFFSYDAQNIIDDL